MMSLKKLLYSLVGLAFAVLTCIAPPALAVDVPTSVQAFHVDKFVLTAQTSQAAAVELERLAAKADAQAGEVVSRVPLDARKDLAAAAADRMIMLVQANRRQNPERWRT